MTIPSGGIVISMDSSKPCHGFFSVVTGDFLEPDPPYFLASLVNICFKVPVLGTPLR